MLTAAPVGDSVHREERKGRLTSTSLCKTSPRGGFSGAGERGGEKAGAQGTQSWGVEPASRLEL